MKKLIRAIHIAKHTALATALTVFMVVGGISSAHALEMVGVIHFSEPQNLPDITIENEQRGIHDLSAYEGQPVLLNIWATWCTPCVAELPKLDALQKRYKDQGLKVVALSEDAGGLALVKRFYAQKSIVLEPFSDPEGATFKALETKQLPTSYLIDSQGDLVAKVVGDIDWLSEESAQHIDALLQAKP